MPVPPSKQVMLSLLKPRYGHGVHRRHAASISLCLMDPRNGCRWPYSEVSLDIYSDSCFIIRPRSMGVLSRRAVGFWDMVQRFFFFFAPRYSYSSRNLYSWGQTRSRRAVKACFRSSGTSNGRLAGSLAGRNQTKRFLLVVLSDSIVRILTGRGLDYGHERLFLYSFSKKRVGIWRPVAGFGLDLTSLACRDELSVHAFSAHEAILLSTPDV